MIHFIGNVQSQFGRGKDKTKRKSRVNPLVGAGLGTVAGGPVGTIAGALIAKGVNKERDRFDKEGARSHLGKVGHDAKLGAKSVGIGSAITAGLAGAALGSSLPTHRKKGFLGLGRDKKAEARDKLKNTLLGAGLGVLSGGVSGAINGAGTGALVGAGRGFVQENRMGKKKKGKFSESTDNVSNFAFGLPQIDRNKTLKRNAQLGAGVGALTGVASSLKGSKSIKSAAIKGALGAVGGSLLASGATGINKLLKRKTIKVGKKTYSYSDYDNITEFAFNLPSSQPKKKSRVGLKTGLVTGLIGGGVTGAVGSGVSGALIDRQIDKEKDRFRKTGARSRAGKIGNDAKIGAKTIGGMSALQGAVSGARLTPGSLKQKIAGAVTSGLTSGVAGTASGGLLGSGVGLVRGFRQPNKKKK